MTEEQIAKMMDKIINYLTVLYGTPRYKGAEVFHRVMHIRAYKDHIIGMAVTQHGASAEDAIKGYKMLDRYVLKQLMKIIDEEEE